MGLQLAPSELQGVMKWKAMMGRLRGASTREWMEPECWVGASCGLCVSLPVPTKDGRCTFPFSHLPIFLTPFVAANAAPFVKDASQGLVYTAPLLAAFQFCCTNTRSQFVQPPTSSPRTSLRSPEITIIWPSSSKLCYLHPNSPLLGLCSAHCSIREDRPLPLPCL